METLGKARVIAQAWEDSLMGRIPKDRKDYPDWYRRRLDACSDCPNNTRNMSFGKVPLKAKLQAMTGRWACSICGCFIREKAWMQTETCPLADRGEKPRWEPMSVMTVDRDSFDIDTDDDTVGLGLTEDGRSFQANIHEVTVGDKVPIRFRIRHDRNFHVTSHHLGCGCMGDIEYDKESDENGYANVRFTLDTSNYAPGPFRKSMGLEGYRGDDPKRDHFYVSVVVVGFAHSKED